MTEKARAMGRQRRSFSAEFKAKVALAAIREQQTINELASAYGVHPNMIRDWKKHLLAEVPQLFSTHTADEEKAHEEERERLFQHIGQLQYELS